MEKELFIKYVEELIIPLFTGSKFAGEEESNARDSEVALGTGGTVLIKPNKNDEYRIILKRNISFNSSDVLLLKSIINELNNVSNLGLLLVDNSYLNRLNMTAIEKAICESITEVASETLLNLVTKLDNYSGRKYEGKTINFGIIINETQVCENKKDNLHFMHMFDNDFFSVLSNGSQSCVEFDKEGYYLGHISLERLRFKPTICPYDYINFARFCDLGRLGVVLNSNGEILIFKNKCLIYSKKNGVWNSYCHDEIIALLSNRRSQSIKEIRKSIYLTALDTSFAATGGCLVYLDKESSDIALSHIDIDDILTKKHFLIKQQQLFESAKKKQREDPNDIVNISYEEFLEKHERIKTSCIRATIDGRKFHELSRKLREELTGIDGAIIVDWDGTVISCGAIIRIEAGSSGGGRLAATKTLAKYGVAVKVSQDGKIQGYMNNKKINRIKSIFTLG